jgi:type IV fimbrial biogenesis protein FimT
MRDVHAWTWKIRPARLKTVEGGMQRQRGITIIEIMVALTVAAVLIGVGLPAFNGYVAQRTMTTQANDFVLAVHYARSEASRRGEIVSVRVAEAANGWTSGWCVVIGTDTTCQGGAAVLRQFGNVGNNTLTANGGLDGVNTLPFNARGFLALNNDGGSLILCPSDLAQNPGRIIALTRVGRVNSTQTNCT